MKKIETVEQVIELANKGQAIWVTLWRRPCAAAFLASWQARLLHSWVIKGYLFKYKKTGGVEKCGKASTTLKQQKA